ncbi:MAG TPA: DUF6065 family protein [Thermoanaerobaculia bacterium]|nr:DUF6065 family protein [Thermoanaerobaculia bacterium]
MILTAYRTSDPAMAIVPAPASRAWMDATPSAFANRCLPLRLANEAGWFLLNPEPVEVRWNGGPNQEDLVALGADGAASRTALSHFGEGIVTWSIPYLFRTPAGFNLLARGPANWFIDGALALEGLIEADWSVAPFTMNWKLTRPHACVRFAAGDPICMIVPQRRRELEGFAPRIQPLAAEPALEGDYERWCASRERFLAALEGPPEGRPRTEWERHYFRGVDVDGRSATDHQVRLRLAPFSVPD